MPIKSKILFLFLCSLAVAFLRGQDNAKPPQQNTLSQGKGFKITAEVNMVNVPVSVRRPEGGFIKGLPQSAFRIYEDGEEQEIILFTQEGVPTSIAIVLDNSGSVRSEWGAIKYATKKFIDNLKPEDQFSILTFNSEIRLKMDWGRKADRVDAVLASIYCKDNTKLWDAVWTVSNDMFKGVQDKKALIIMSDGLDNESEYTYEEALEKAIMSEAMVYVVSKTEAVREMRMSEAKKFNTIDNIPQEFYVQADLMLRKLSYETGGRVLYPTNFGQLGDVYASVDEELRNQYTLGYLSTNTVKDGSYRRIEVRVNAPEARISARPGYYAPGRLPSSPKHKDN